MTDTKKPTLAELLATPAGKEFMQAYEEAMRQGLEDARLCEARDKALMRGLLKGNVDE